MDGRTRRQNALSMARHGCLTDPEPMTTPHIAGKALTISCEVTPQVLAGVILAQGGNQHGYALYLQDGKPIFSVREKPTIVFCESARDAERQIYPRSASGKRWRDDAGGQRKNRGARQSAGAQLRCNRRKNSASARTRASRWAIMSRRIRSKEKLKTSPVSAQ